MNQLLPVIIFSTLLTAFTVKQFDSPEIIQMVVALPQLNSKSLQENLELDIQKLSGIKFIDISLISKTLILNYDSRKLSPEEVYHILNKWGCSLGESFFQTLVSLN